MTATRTTRPETLLTAPRTAPGQPALRLAATILLWLAALAPFAILIAGHTAPAATGRAVAVATAVGLRVAAITALVGGGALLIWPPAVPALRVGWRRFRDRLRVDQGPLIEALSRLEHFESAPDHLRAARVLMNLGQPGRALPHLIGAVRIEPDNAGAHFLLGKALLGVGAPAEAVRALERAVAIEPEHGFGDALLELARARRRRGDDTGAIAALDDRERRIGPERRGDLLRGELARDAGDAETARAMLERAAAAPGADRSPTAEEQLVRARARVALWRLPRHGGTG